MKILDWRNHHQRIDVVNSILGSEILEDISKSKIESCWSDDLSWLPDNFDIESFEKKFLENFRAIKCFHACSPISIENYLINGFTGGNHEENIALFNSIFSDIPLHHRESAIEKSSSSRKDEINKTFFLCDSYRLINRDGNYLIYGSEYLTVLAVNLPVQRFSNEDFRQRLKGFGIPTIFEADIDFSLLDHYQIDQLLFCSLADWGNYYLFNKDFTPYEMSIIAKQKLPPSVIVHHWHPEKIHDPYHYGNWYISKKTTCKMCEKL